MKIPTRSHFASLAIASLVPLAGCNRQPAVTPEQQELEIQRRVSQKVAEENVTRTQADLDKRAQELTAREQQLAQRETVAAQPMATPAAINTASNATNTADDQTATIAKRRSKPEPVGSLDDEDRVGGTPSNAYDRFYTELTPHGDWIETGRYGLVWQPAIAAMDRHWRPYTYGHWAYTRDSITDSDLGWTWVSNEPFGWATYHYGRWVRLVGAGWVWIPGTLWAPAWVSWRTGDDYVGWAPLPPEGRLRVGFGISDSVDSQCGISVDFYSFVPTESLADTDIRLAVLPPERNVTVINQTVNVTNITVNKNGVSSRGPAYNQVSQKVRQPLTVYRAQRANLPAQAIRSSSNGILRIPASTPTTKTTAATQLPTVKRRLPTAIAVTGSVAPSIRTAQKTVSGMHTPTAAITAGHAVPTPPAAPTLATKPHSSTTITPAHPAAATATPHVAPTAPAAPTPAPAAALTSAEAKPMSAKVSPAHTPATNNTPHTIPAIPAAPVHTATPAPSAKPHSPTSAKKHTAETPLAAKHPEATPNAEKTAAAHAQATAHAQAAAHTPAAHIPTPLHQPAPPRTLQHRLPQLTLRRQPPTRQRHRQHQNTNGEAEGRRCRKPHTSLAIRVSHGNERAAIAATGHRTCPPLP